VNAVRIDTADAPVIDGDLSDAVWEKAAVIDSFTQRSPNPYEPATERTVVRLLYDANNLYFGFYNYDSAPDQIVVRNKQRDGQLFTSDSVMIYLDPGQTRRNAYNFEIGASGGRTDQLELNNTEELREWNTIFEARARIVHDGWVAEFAIPFKSLSYETSQTTWGFDLGRRIYHKNERVHWSGFNPALDFTDVSQTGDLAGIEDVSQGIGLDVQVHGAPRVRHDRQAGAGTDRLSMTAGGNVFYKIRPRSPTRSPSIPIFPMRRSTSARSIRRASRCSHRRHAISSCRTCPRSSSAGAASAATHRTGCRTTGGRSFRATSAWCRDGRSACPSATSCPDSLAASTLARSAC
jgi:hypothetical protein